MFSIPLRGMLLYYKDHCIYCIVSFYHSFLGLPGASNFEGGEQRRLGKLDLFEREKRLRNGFR